jgi:hypothetical protein
MFLNKFVTILFKSKKKNGQQSRKISLAGYPDATINLNKVSKRI